MRFMQSSTVCDSVTVVIFRAGVIVSFTSVLRNDVCSATIFHMQSRSERMPARRPVFETTTRQPIWMAVMRLTASRIVAPGAMISTLLPLLRNTSATNMFISSSIVLPRQRHHAPAAVVYP